MSVLCSVCKDPITETGTAIDGWPCHIKCYHEYKHHEWMEALEMTVCKKCMKCKHKDRLSNKCKGTFKVSLRSRK